MKKINGFNIEREPQKCGECVMWAGYKGSCVRRHDSKAECILLGKTKRFSTKPPKCCEKLFSKILTSEQEEFFCIKL